MAIFSTDSKRPRYFDRQNLRAEDLSQEQLYQTQRHRQLTRHLHGWGVVCGALLQPDENDTVSIGEGFAITPAGNALRIPEIRGFDILAALQKAPCLGGTGSCEDTIPPLPTPSPSPTPTPSVSEPLDVYLIARPVLQPSDPHTGIPAGCGHPGNTWEYSRECDGVCVEIVCDLPEVHQKQRVSCDLLRQFFCADAGREAYPALLNSLFACPASLDPHHDYVVLARLRTDWITTPFPQERRRAVVEIDYRVRRILAPTQLMQDYFHCLCSQTTPAPTPAPTSAPTAPPTARPTSPPTQGPTIRPTSPFTMRPTMFTIPPTFFDFTIRTGGGILDDPLGPLTIPGVDLGLDIRVYDPLRGADVPVDAMAGVNAGYVAPLRGMNIHSALDLYQADTVAVATALGVSEVAVAELKDSALNVMARAQPLNLSSAEYDLGRGINMPVAEIQDVGRVRSEALRNNGFNSVADVANASAPQVAQVLGISERQAGTLIGNARNRIRLS